MNWYECGKHDYRAWVTSKHFAALNHDAHAEDVIRLFLPPIPQDLMQIARPLPHHIQEWLRGFEDEKTNQNMEK